MVRVADRFCIDRFEASLVDDVEERALSPFYPPRVEELGAVLDEWTARLADGKAGSSMPLPLVPAWQREDTWGPRAVSWRGSVPHGYVDKFMAQTACASAGKRLCTVEEWTTACRGENDTLFPYGAEYREGLCNIYRKEHPGTLLHGNPTFDQLDPRMNQVAGSDGPLLRMSGATESCKSRWGDDGVFDMVGNVDEWVEAPEGTYLGGFYSRTTNLGCQSKVNWHEPAYYNYSTGFRCCDVLR